VAKERLQCKKMRRRVKIEGNIFVGFAILLFEYCFIKFQTKVVERVRNWVEGEKYKDNVGLVVTEREMEIGVCMCIGDRTICRCVYLLWYWYHQR